MDNLYQIFITFGIWFFSWNFLLSFMERKKMNSLYYYLSGLIVSVIVYYFSNDDNDSNE